MVQQIQISRAYKITSIYFAMIHGLLMVLSVILIGQETIILKRLSGFESTEAPIDSRLLFGCLPFFTGTALMIFPFFPYTPIPITAIVTSVFEVIIFFFSLFRVLWILEYKGRSMPVFLKDGPNVYRDTNIKNHLYINPIVYSFGILFSNATIVLMVIFYRKPKSDNGSERKSVEE